MTRAKNTGDILSEIWEIEILWQQYDLEILLDNAPWIGSDIVLWRNISSSGGIVYGIVNADVNNFTWSGEYNFYGKYHLWYRDVSGTEILSLEWDPSLIYDYSIFPDKIFSSIYVKDIQWQTYNAWEILSLDIEILDEFKQNLIWENWWDIPTENHIFYNIVY